MRFKITQHSIFLFQTQLQQKQLKKQSAFHQQSVLCMPFLLFLPIFLYLIAHIAIISIIPQSIHAITLNMKQNSSSYSIFSLFEPQTSFHIKMPIRPPDIFSFSKSFGTQRVRAQRCPEASIRDLCKVERLFEIKQKNSQMAFDPTYNQILKKTHSFHSTMPSHQPLPHHYSFLPLKSTQNIFAMNISRFKPKYNEQAHKKSQTPKKSIKISSNTSHPNPMRSYTRLSIKRDEQPSEPTLNLRPPFVISDIQDHLWSPASKQQRKKFVFNVYRGAIYSLLKLKPPSQDVLQSREAFLSEPTASRKKFLLLDLDQTLIHAERRGEEDGKVCYRFAYRPHLFPFLQRMNELFEVYVFSAAQKRYAEAVVKKLNREKMLIKDILHRQHCLETKKGKFLKDLRIIKNRRLQDIVIIDNLVESFGLQLSNGVPILEYKGCPNDCQLISLIPLMERLSEAEDVRTVLREVYRLQEVSKLDRKEVEQYFSTAE